MTNIELISYIPTTESYKVFYPRHFILEETEEFIVTITSPVTNSNLTITGYQASLDVDEKILTDFFQEVTKNYREVTEISKEISSKRLLLEQRFRRNDVNWVWWGLAKENQIIIISVNTVDILSLDDYNLFKFIIDTIEIFPSVFEESKQ